MTFCDPPGCDCCTSRSSAPDVRPGPGRAIVNRMKQLQLTPYILLIGILIISSYISSCNNSNTSSSDSTDSSSLPNISYFQTSPTDQFLMDMELLIDGQSFRGDNAQNPHAGAHLYIKNTDGNTWPKDGVDSPENYPPIYAIANGTIDHITTYHPVSDNFRYGISLTIATKDGNNVNFYYSIEPFINPNDNSFYEQYILVNEGQTVSKGDIIAYFYLEEDGTNENAHIHFHMNYKDQFLSPSIFTKELVSSFHAKFDTRGKDGDTPLPNSMGYQLTATQNPFELKAVGTL